MKQLSVAKLIEFRRSTDRRRVSFAESITSTKAESPSEGGGNYWIICISAVRKSYKENSLKSIEEKIEEFSETLKDTSAMITRGMYKRNIIVLQAFINFDFKKIRPVAKLVGAPKSVKNSALKIKGLEIQIKDADIFNFSKNGVTIFGGIWVVAKLGGYTKEELGMFAGILHRYLKVIVGKEGIVSPRQCIAVDVVGETIVRYSQIQSAKVKDILSDTIDDLKKLF
jgi:hypothetical protein